MELKDQVEERFHNTDGEIQIYGKHTEKYTRIGWHDYYVLINLHNCYN